MIRSERAARISSQNVVERRHFILIGNGYAVQTQKRRRDLQYVSLVVSATFLEVRAAREQKALFTMIA